MKHGIDRLVGRALGVMGDLALLSWPTYRLLHAPALMGVRRLRIGRARARAAFWNARHRVPAYAAFLAEKGALTPARFEDIPPMDKPGYIKRWPLEATCVGGRLPRRGAVIDESSGSSGTANNWVRGPGERRDTRRLIQYLARATFGDEPFVLLNAFALGPWATGMNVSMAMVDACVVKSIGPDAAKIVATLELLGPQYRYVLAGYPPFLKALVDSARLDWSLYDVCAVMGGEGLSEPLRAALNRCFRRTVSSYGASDLEINLAVESELTTTLRQAVADRPALARDLYGEGQALPMMFQYDPLNHWLETDAERNLLVTVNRLENVSPRIRYNIRDRALVRPYEEIRAIALDHGFPHLPATGLPLLFHWGRQDQAVAFYGSKVTPEDLQSAILRTDGLAGRMANFALHPWEDDQANKRLDFYLELAPEDEVPETEAALALGEALIASLAVVNQDFSESIRMAPAALRPRLLLFPHGEGPLAGQDPRVKRRYVV